MPTQSKKILLSGHQVCVLQPILSKELGRSTAHILQHIHYMLNNKKLGKMHEGQKWIYNTYKDWQDSIRIYSEITIRRAIAKLEKLGILRSKTLSTKKSDRTKWYTISYDTIKDRIPFLSTPETDHDMIKMSIPSDQNEPILIEQRLLTKKDPINPIQPQKKDVKEGICAQKLFDIWNQKLEGENPITLTKTRARNLMAAFKFKFKASIEQWKSFCQSITTSDFLMGRVKSSFRARLDWVLKFDIIQRILEGDFGVKIEEHFPLYDPKECIEENTQDESPLIQNIRQNIQKKVGLASYKSWFMHVKIHQKGEETLLICKNDFCADYITSHFSTVLHKMGLVVGKV